MGVRMAHVVCVRCVSAQHALGPPGSMAGRALKHTPPPFDIAHRRGARNIRPDIVSLCGRRGGYRRFLVSTQQVMLRTQHQVLGFRLLRVWITQQTNK